MPFHSIRFRLTAWYFSILALFLLLFGIAAWFAMRASLIEAVDHDLRMRTDEVRDFLQSELKIGPSELMDELQEQAMLGLGGELLEVRNGNGVLLYRSPKLPKAAAVAPNASVSDSDIEYRTDHLNNFSMRIAARRITINTRIFVIEVGQPLHEFEESMERFERMLLIFGPALMLIATIGGFWMSGRALSPVDQIISEARSIGIDNLAERLPVPRARDELQRLARTLNEMLGRIETAVQRLIQFTADASHELRAPLTLIHTAAQFSLRRERTREELIEAMRKIQGESGRASQMVEDLLTLARADSGKVELRVSPIDLIQVAKEAADRLVTLAESKTIKVSVDIPSGVALILGEEQPLARALLVIIENAVKYTGEGGQIAMLVRARDEHAEVILKDTGIGISANDLPRIFDRFWRADKVRSRDTGGVGLGLSIAQWIIERHNGSISVQSQPGFGSEFIVHLPLLYPTTDLDSQLQHQVGSLPDL